MKLADYAKQLGISYQTAWRHFKAGKIPYPTTQLESGTVIVDYDPKTNKQAVNKAAIYARVSSAENKNDLDRQAERLTQYAIARGYQVQHIIKEVGSGFFDNRKKLENLLKQNDYQVLIVEHKERLSFFGTHYIDILLSRCGVTLEVVNMTENGMEELMTDFMGIINFVTTRLYGQREAKQKTKKILATLQGTGDNQEL